MKAETLVCVPASDFSVWAADGHCYFVSPWGSARLSSVEAPFSGMLLNGSSAAEAVRTACAAITRERAGMIPSLRGDLSTPRPWLVFLPADDRARAPVLQALGEFASGPVRGTLRARMTVPLTSAERADPRDADFVHRVREGDRFSVTLVNLSGRPVMMLRETGSVRGEIFNSFDLAPPDVGTRLERALTTLEERPRARLTDGITRGRAMVVLLPADGTIRAHVVRSLLGFFDTCGTPVTSTQIISVIYPGTVIE